jgi:hypothetical protein
MIYTTVKKKYNLMYDYDKSIKRLFITHTDFFIKSKNFLLLTA